MRAVVQRVRHARVLVDELKLAEIAAGLVVLLGIGQGDGEAEAQWMAHKVAGLRIFSDEEGKFNLSVQDVAGQILLISQFTLYGDARKGRRPSFTAAAPPETAAPLIDRVAQLLREQDLVVECGQFQAHMLVELANDGPVTIILDREPSGTGAVF